MNASAHSASEGLRQKMLTAANDTDLFRCVVRGLGVIEDALDTHINDQLSEPLERLDQAPFKQKLNLSIGLGIVAPEHRGGMLKLANLRNALAHAEREPEDVTAAEVKAICRQLDADLVEQARDLLPDNSA